MTSYKFVDGEFRFEFEIRRSKFIVSLFGEADEDSAVSFVQRVKKEFPDATHNCYAYVSDIRGNAARFSDDGEPSGTAGMPMLEVLKKRGLTASAAVVTRYFGGIKLGAGGLVGAYAGCTSDALDKAVISTKTLCDKLRVSADYSQFAVIEGHLRRSGVVLGDIDYADKVTAHFYAIPTESGVYVSAIESLTAGLVKTETVGTEYVKLKVES